MKDNKVKQNINCLEYPLWFQDENAAEKAEQGMVWKDREGYIYKAGYKPPVKTDAIFLLYLLMQSQQQNYTQEISLTRYQILKACGLDDNAQWYNRLEDSLERWKMVGIKFSGTFYDGESYSTINFGVIDSWSIHEQTKELNVIFSPSFITMMKGKGFFKYIDFKEFKKLHSPLATRLYEILCKTFHGRDTWEINAIKLANKIPMKERYPAHIIPKIKAAVNRINKSTDSRFILEVKRVRGGKAILCFTKETASKSALSSKQPTKQKFVIPDKPEIKKLIELLPAPRRSQKTILEPLIAFYEMKDFDYVARNIRYTNKYTKNNYRSYFIKALQHDYGLAMQEEEEAEQRIAAEKALLAQKQAQKEADEQKLREEQEINKKRVQEYIENLSEENKANLQAEALASLSDKLRKIVENKGPGSKIMLNIAMEKIAATHIQSQP